MVRLIRLTKNGNPTGFAIPASAHDSEPAPEGDGKTWAEHKYKLDSYDDDGTPYKAERPAAPAAERAEAKKGD